MLASLHHLWQGTMTEEQKLEAARRATRNHRNRIARLKTKYSGRVWIGSPDCSKYSDGIMKSLIKEGQELKALGCRVEDGGKVVLITDEWIAEQEAKETEVDRLFKKYKKTGDQQDLKNWLLAFANQ